MKNLCCIIPVIVYILAIFTGCDDTNSLERIQGETADKGIETYGNITGDDADVNRPMINNLTLVGRNGESTDLNNSGMHLRNDFRAEIKNSIISRFDGPSWMLDKTTTAGYNQPLLSIGNILLFENENWIDNDGELFEDDYLQGDPEFVNPGSPNFNYTPASEIVKAGSALPANSFFDMSAAYLGAFNPQSQIPRIFEGTWVRTPDN